MVGGASLYKRLSTSAKALASKESFFLGVKKTIQNYPPISSKVKSAYGGRNFYKLKDVCENF